MRQPTPLTVIHQEGLRADYLDASWQTLRMMLNILPGQQRYRPVNIKDSQPHVNAWVNRGIYQACQEQRYTRAWPAPIYRFHQIHARPITDAMDNMTAQPRNLQMIMIMRDSIYVDGMNFFYGYSTNPTGNIILSAGIHSPFEVSLNQYRYMLAHELGHKLGATDFALRGNNEIRDYPTLGVHCLTPGCLMSVVPDAKTQQRMARNGATFCPGCLRAIRQHLSR